ncbi:MAG TPA: pitrilysin family protein [Caulobacteraceae bacterium]|nr:pitrilysin family protein [Caulobacteraceae bacterium]
MKRLAVLSVSALALLAASPAAFAQPATSAASASALTPPKLDYKFRQLPNGLKVYSLRDPKAKNVTVQVWYDVGSKDDPQGRSGFAHLFEHILSRKTVNMPLGTMNKLTEDVGGSRNASTGSDFTNYFEIVPAEYLETMLWTHAERMARPVVDEEVFKAEREIVKEELRQRVLSVPYGRLQRFVLAENSFDGHPYRRPGIGSIEELNAATIDDARAFHEAYYSPSTATLIVSGDFDQAQLDRYVDKYFAPIPKAAKPAPKSPLKPDAPRAESRAVTAYAPNVPLPAIAWSYQTPPVKHEDTAAFTVLDAILARGESSRLYKSLVYDKQVASAAYTFFNNQEEGGFFAPIVTLAGGRKIEEAEAALGAELARLRDAPVTADELAEAKNELAADELRQRETASGRAFLLGYALVSTGDPAWADKQVAAIQKVTAADVQRVARKYLGDNQKVAIRYMDESQRPAGQADAWANPAPMPTFLTVPAATRAPNQLADESVRQAPPAPGPKRTIAAPVIAERTLSNGLRVIVAKSSDVPIATAYVVAGGGSAADPTGRAGLADMTAALMTQGAGGMTAPQIAARMEALGGTIGGGAGSDGSNMFVSAPTANLEAAGRVLADVVMRPSFAAEEVERRRKQSLDSLAVQMKNPGAISGWAASRVMYGAAPYGSPAGGTADTLKSIKREDLVAAHQTWWRPDNATLILSGGIEPEAGFALAEKLFGGWAKPAAPVPALPSRAGPAPDAKVVVIDLPNAGQASVVAALRSVERKDPQVYPLSIANAVMGGGSNGRLFQEVRAKRGLSYGAYSGLGPRREEGFLSASAQTKNESAVQVADLFLAELERLAKEPIPAGDIERRKAFLIGNFGRQIETSAGLGGYLAGLVQSDLPLSEVGTYPDKIAGATSDQIAAAVARELPVSQTSLVIVGDAKLFLDELKKTRPNVEVIPIAELDLNSPTLRKGK